MNKENQTIIKLCRWGCGASAEHGTPDGACSFVCSMEHKGVGVRVDGTLQAMNVLMYERLVTSGVLPGKEGQRDDAEGGLVS